MKKGDLVWVCDSLDVEESLRVFELEHELDTRPLPFVCKGYGSDLPETPGNVRVCSNDALIGWKHCRPYREPPVKGDLVWVGDTEQEVRNRDCKRVFLADVGGKMPIIAVSPDSCFDPIDQDLLDEYNSGEYETTSWKFCEKATEAPAKELTVAEIEKLLGYPVKIVGEKA